MFQRIFISAVLAGFVAGLVLSVLQEFTTTPLILAAEAYENGGDQAHHGHGHGAFVLAHGSAPHAHPEGDEAWAPADGLERSLYTALANVIMGVGFALLLVAGFAISRQRIDGRRGIVWGLAGFAVFSLAPGLGLPPELPGSMAADIVARQAWWLATVIATGLGLWLMAFTRAPWWKGLGILAIAAPHLIGAPHPETFGGPVPPEMAGHFVAASLATMAVFWVLLGWLAGSLYGRGESREDAEEAERTV